jgi:hypothetical protein
MAKQTDFDPVIGNRGGEDVGEMGLGREGVRGSAEMKIQGRGYKARGSRRRHVGLANPDQDGGSRVGQRPHNQAVKVFQNEGLKAHTRMTQCS